MFPTTSDGKLISPDDDFTEPKVVQGLIRAMILPSQRGYYDGYDQDFLCLMASGLEAVFSGLTQFAIVKHLVDANADQAEDFIFV